ncbi:MAG: dihydrodipicolinate synthase family protein [Clostridiaceae bacterium]|nr:dihydrodipicolinate synthase family protein [Clostridiaceae bacterium]
MKKPYGIMPAALTVWNEDETFNEKGMEHYLKWLLDNGAHSISSCGSTGENIAMHMEEQKKIIEVTVKTIAGQVPVYVGTGRYTTSATIELSKYAESVGADGVMIILPYYLKPYKGAAMDHLRAVSKEINIPIMVYNNPWFAGYELNAKDIKQLVDEGVVNSVKSAHGDAARIHELKFECGDKLKVLYGHDYAGLEGIAAGADGWLSGILSALPKQCRQIYDAVAVEKDIEKGRQILNQLMPFINYLTYEKVNDKPHWLEIFKATVNMQGIPVGKPRRPLGGLDNENVEKLKKVLDIALS